MDSTELRDQRLRRKQATTSDGSSTLELIHVRTDKMRHHSPSWFMLSSEAIAHIHNDVLIKAIVFTICAYGMVLLRWYSRIVCRPEHFGLDDCLTSIAMVSHLKKNPMINS
jgi:hypothetical protein